MHPACLCTNKKGSSNTHYTTLNYGNIRQIYGILDPIGGTWFAQCVQIFRHKSELAWPSPQPGSSDPRVWEPAASLGSLWAPRRLLRRPATGSMALFCFSQGRRNDKINKICVLEGAKTRENGPKKLLLLGNSMTIKFGKICKLNFVRNFVVILEAPILHVSETGRIRFRRARFQTASSVSFFALIELLGENSVSSLQPSICV